MPRILMPMIHIYRIDFEDGSSYVGQSRNVKQRVYAHLKRPSNPSLYTRLSEGMPHTVTVLSRHRKQACADVAERKAIAKLEQPINRILQRGAATAKRDYSRRKYPPKIHGTLRCVWCQEKKPATDFHGDRCRASGRASKCKACKSVIHRLKTEGILIGRSTSDSYAMAKEMCKA